MTTGEPGNERGNEQLEVLRSEEQVAVSTEPVEAGRVHVRKHVDHDVVQQEVERMAEQASTDVVPPLAEDTGEVLTFDDGSISIPILEEEIVVQKRLVVRERIVVRKTVVTERETVEATLRRERVEIDADPDVAGRVTGDAGGDPQR